VAGNIMFPGGDREKKKAVPHETAFTYYTTATPPLATIYLHSQGRLGNQHDADFTIGFFLS